MIPPTVITWMSERETVKLYFDYKSPFAYLAKDPAFELPVRYAIDLRWIPFVLRIKGSGERSVYSERKVRYSYMDARRWANRRGGFKIMGPPKIYDSRPALIGALWAQRQDESARTAQRDFFRRYTDETFRRFFERRLEIDRADEIASLIAELGGAPSDYRSYFEGLGPRVLEACLDEADRDQIFGVPTFVFRGELFWGHDRMPLLEERLAEARLTIGAAESNR
jgi:2-hydroxychromene-2-carboxylate isomerase